MRRRRVNVTQIRRMRWLRTGTSHVIAFVAGIGLALVLAPRPADFIGPLRAPPSLAATSEFHRALQAVMVQMDAAMCITPSANADLAFARAMIPHHQGAVEMAKLELLYGRDARLRRLAQGIVVEQSQEIALLRDILDGASAAPGIGVNPQGGGSPWLSVTSY
jgi:hypothetical protein